MRILRKSIAGRVFFPADPDESRRGAESFDVRAFVKKLCAAGRGLSRKRTGLKPAICSELACSHGCAVCDGAQRDVRI
jgi:hypothetical protein